MRAVMIVVAAFILAALAPTMGQAVEPGWAAVDIDSAACS